MVATAKSLSAESASSQPAATAHLDTFAWRPTAKPGRPKGGDALGVRAAWAMLKKRYTG